MVKASMEYSAYVVHVHLLIMPRSYIRGCNMFTGHRDIAHEQYGSSYLSVD